MATMLSSPPSPSPSPSPSPEFLSHALARVLDDLHEQLADDQLRTLKRLRLDAADLLALGDVGAAPGGAAEPQSVARLRDRGLVEQSGRGDAHRPTAAGRALLDELHDGRARAIRRFVDGLDRGQRLRLAGALHLLSGLDGEPVLGA